MNSDREVQCYAVRRLNPFLGVLQILETRGGRASTANGLVWHLELLANKPAGWGSLGSGEEDQGWRLCGMWSEKDGLVNARPPAECEGREESALCQYLITAIRAHQGELPFALADQREMWLLDAEEKKPLALLCSMPPGAALPSEQPRYWRGSLGKRGLPGQRRFPEIDRLETEVRKRAGFNLTRIWVTWDPDRTRAETAEGEWISGDAFPVFGLRQDWPDREVQALVRSYIDWTAPSLLTLPNLNCAERARLESKLGKQACSIEYHWRLYPTIVDEEKIVAARVQARLQWRVNTSRTEKTTRES